MKDVVRFLAQFVAVLLIILGALSFRLPADALITIMVIVGFIAAIIIVIVVEWWRRDEVYYEERLKNKEERARVRTHI